MHCLWRLINIHGAYIDAEDIRHLVLPLIAQMEKLRPAKGKVLAQA